MVQDRQETTKSPVNCHVWATQSKVETPSFTVKLPKAKTCPRQGGDPAEPPHRQGQPQTSPPGNDEP